MRASLKHRLDRIEKAIPKPATAAASISGAAILAERLAALGVIRSPEESLAETTARALGISIPELRAELMRLAYSTPSRVSYEKAYTI